ncbi:MAG: porin, partial [Armatimonadota bacterium]
MKSLAAIVLLAVCACVAWAQTPTDVLRDHWAYEAVKGLVEKGYLEGYPDGSFLGNRTMTRYELATVIKRIVDALGARIESIEQKSVPQQQPPQNGAPAEKPTVTREDLEQIRKLVEEFKPELAVIGTRLDNFEASLEEMGLTVKNLEAIITDPEGAFEATKSDVSKLKKATVSGYVQARFNLFRNDPDKPNRGSEPTDNFSIRRARLKISGKPTPNSSVVVQLDAGQGYKGDAGPSVTIKDAYLQYAFAGDPMLWTTISMGQMKWPFGFSVVESSGVRECPERPLIVQRLF